MFEVLLVNGGDRGRAGKSLKACSSSLLAGAGSLCSADRRSILCL